MTALHTLPNRIDELYVASGSEHVFKARLASATTFELVLQPLDAFACLAVHPKEESFFTCHGDRRIHKWHARCGPEWAAALQATGSAISE